MARNKNRKTCILMVDLLPETAKKLDRLKKDSKKSYEQLINEFLKLYREKE